MKILFDHCVTKPLRREFPYYEIKLAREMGWQGLKNGRLLDAAVAKGFDVLPTVDQNIQYQQNLKGRNIAVIIEGGRTRPTPRGKSPRTRGTGPALNIGRMRMTARDRIGFNAKVSCKRFVNQLKILFTSKEPRLNSVGWVAPEVTLVESDGTR